MISKSTEKLIRSLEHKKYRMQHGLFVAEGRKTVLDLMRRYEPVRVFSTRADDEAETVTAEELRRLSLLQHPQDMLALFRLPRYEQTPEECRGRFLSRPHTISDDLCLALDGIQDPGNLGTIIRTADWFGISDIICSRDTADAFAPKVVQASMGSLARVSLTYTDLSGFLATLDTGIRVYGTFPDGSNIYRQRLHGNGIIVMGNEGKGISDAVQQRVTERLSIPSYAPSHGDSLNVAIATAVVCAEFRRQASQPAPLS